MLNRWPKWVRRRSPEPGGRGRRQPETRWKSPRGRIGVGWAILACLLILRCPAGAEETPEAALQALAERLAPALSAESVRRQTLTGSLEFLRADGVAPKLVGRKLTVAWQAPDRFRLGGNLGNGWVEVGRLGRNLWLWDSPRRRVVAGSSTRGSKQAPVALEEVGVPFLEQSPAALAAVLDLQGLGASRWNRIECEGLAIRPRDGSLSLLGWPRFEARVWWQRAARLPVHLEWTVPEEKVRLSLQVHQLKLEPAWAEARWQLEVPKGARVEWTSLPGFTREVPPGLRELLEGWAIPEPPAERRVVRRP